MVKMMLNKSDNTKKILEQLLGDLYKKQILDKKSKGDSFLQSQDGQFLGNITSNRYDKNSIINRYGPYGSRYSSTSIYNPYSPYGSRYGNFSVNNPYCNKPPKLIINDKFVAYITKNRNIDPRIDTDSLIGKLKSDINSILRISPGDSLNFEFSRNDSYIIANDGTFLGKITSNQYDSDSVFNNYGNYGSEYSNTSIFNTYGNYGNEYSSLSPYNEYSSTPPKIYIDGQFWGYLTKNNYISGNRVDPDNLKNWILMNNL